MRKMKKVKGFLTDEEKAARDDRRANIAHRHAVINGGVKGLAVLNSAGVAAMLGFTQALVSKPEFLNFKPYSMAALSLFLIGTIAAALLFVPYGTYIQERNRRYKSWVLYACFFLGAFSIACAAIGALLVVIGIDRAF